MNAKRLLVRITLALAAGCQSGEIAESEGEPDPGELTSAVQQEARHTGQAVEVEARALLVQSQNYPIQNAGIAIDYGWVPEGMYQTPFVIEFGSILKFISGGRVDVESYNTYTVGNFHKPNGVVNDVSNNLNPQSKFKDSWLGVYFIMDDAAGKGRRFMLNNPDGAAGDFANLNLQSLFSLPLLDQAVIVWSSHDGQPGYGPEQFAGDFYAQITSVSPPSVVVDMHGRPWLRFNGETATVAALTDTSITNMNPYTSIAAYLGYPTDNVYRQVAPWHPMTLKGDSLTTYIDCGVHKFWAIAYYNGSAFVKKDGEAVDSWSNTDLPALMSQAFANIDIHCAAAP